MLRINHLSVSNTLNMNLLIKLFYLVVLSLLFFSCSTASKKDIPKEKTLEELLIKTWELHQAAGKNSKTETELNEIYHDKYVEFKENNTYNTNATTFFKKETGTWHLNTTRDSIYINKNTEHQIVFSIFNIYERGMSLMSYETETDEEWQGQFYTLSFVEVDYYGSTQIPKEKQ